MSKNSRVEMDDTSQIREIDTQNELYVDSEIKVTYDKGKIRIYDSMENQIAAFKLYESRLMNIFAKEKLAERLLRLEPRSVLRLQDGDLLISSKGFLYRYNISINGLKREFQYAGGTVNPLAFCTYFRDGHQELVFGDYGGHDKDGRVGIYVWRNGSYLELTSFGGHEIDHIHRVEYDRFRDCYWAFTGDLDAGCGIWKVDCDSGEITPFLVGKQIYRACVAFALENSIIYATDSPLEQNYIYELDLITKKLKILYEMPGPCIYGTSLIHQGRLTICLSTSVEGDSSLSKWKYRLSNKLGSGVTDRYSHIIYGNLEDGFKEACKNKKDIWNMWLFQFGNHRFPTQSLDGAVRFVPQSCSYKNGHTFELTL